MNFSEYIRIIKVWNYFDLKNEEEYKIYAKGYFLIIFIFLLFLILFFMSMAHDIEGILLSILFFLPFIIVSGGYCLFIFYIPKLEKKYGMKSKVRLGATFQHQVFFYASLCPGFVSFILIFSWFLGKLTLGLGLSLAFFIPVILMLLMLNIFNDSSVWKIDDNKNKTIVLGYNPGIYFFPSLIIGLYGYFYGFKTLSSALFINNINLIYGSIVWILIIFCFQLILMFPDKVNNYWHFDLRESDGCIGFIAINLILFVIVAMFIQPILLVLKTSLFEHISFFGLVKWVLILLGAFILYKILSKKKFS